MRSCCRSARLGSVQRTQPLLGRASARLPAPLPCPAALTWVEPCPPPVPCSYELLKNSARAVVERHTGGGRRCASQYLTLGSSCPLCDRAGLGCQASGIPPRHPSAVTSPRCAAVNVHSAPPAPPSLLAITRLPGPSPSHPGHPAASWPNALPGAPPARPPPPLRAAAQSPTRCRAAPGCRPSMSACAGVSRTSPSGGGRGGGAGCEWTQGDLFGRGGPTGWRAVHAGCDLQEGRAICQLQRLGPRGHLAAPRREARPICPRQAACNKNAAASPVIANRHTCTHMHGHTHAHARTHLNTHTHTLCRLSDQGGGIPEGMVDSVWQFGFTTSGARGGRLARPARGGSGLRGAGGAPLGGGGEAGSSGEGTGGALGEGLGLDTAPPGASFGAAFSAIEGGSRFRIAGALARPPRAPARSPPGGTPRIWLLATCSAGACVLLKGCRWRAGRLKAGPCVVLCPCITSARPNLRCLPGRSAGSLTVVGGQEAACALHDPHPSPHPALQAWALACPSAACMPVTLEATCAWSTCPGACVAPPPWALCFGRLFRV